MISEAPYSYGCITKKELIAALTQMKFEFLTMDHFGPDSGFIYLPRYTAQDIFDYIMDLREKAESYQFDPESDDGDTIIRGYN